MKFEVVLNPKAFRREIQRQASPWVSDIGYDLQTTIFRSYGLPKSGRIYKRPKPLTGVYRASAPGEPPAVRTGNMIRSLRLTFPDLLTAQIMIDTPYAALLEHGTARMLPRPHARPAIDSVKNQYKGGVRRAIQ